MFNLYAGPFMNIVALPEMSFIVGVPLFVGVIS
jgi:hypothetical protein